MVPSRNRDGSNGVITGLEWAIGWTAACLLYIAAVVYSELKR